MTDLRIFLASVHVEIDAALARLATVDTDMLPPDLRIRYDDGSDAVERDASGCGTRRGGTARGRMLGGQQGADDSRSAGSARTRVVEHRTHRGIDHMFLPLQCEERGRRTFREQMMTETKPPIPRIDIELLTARERQVLDSLLRGDTVLKIARDLLVGLGTIKSHRAHILQKFGVVSLRELRAVLQLNRE